MNTQNQDPTIRADATRLAGEEYRTQLKTDSTGGWLALAFYPIDLGHANGRAT